MKQSDKITEPPPRRRYKMRLAYDGADFCGWQFQPNGVSIQMTLQEALNVLLQDDVRVRGAGRTDTGVHALEQVAHFTASTDIDISKLLRSLNGVLPRTIRVLEISVAEEGFHAQYSAIGKIYHYHITFGLTQSPFHRWTRWHVKYKVDVERLRQAAEYFVGTHDFSSFANQQNSGSAGRNPVRTIRRLDVVEEDGGLRLEFEGNGFLYKMVRNIVGTLLEVATRKRPIDDIARLLEAKNRRLAGQVAPAHGLTLVKVLYDEDEK